MLSLDQNILKEGSASRKRHFDYGKICDSLDIVVFSGTAGMANDVEQEQENVKIYGIAGKNKIIKLINAYKKAKELCDNKVDLVTTQDAAFTGFIGYLLKRKYGIKLNIQIHGNEEKFLNKVLFYFTQRKIIRSADSLRVVSERLKKYVMKRYGIEESRIFKIQIYTPAELKTRNAANSVGGQKPRNTPSGSFTILTVGRLVKIKNIGLQIKALADVIKIFPKARLVIVGDGPERKKLVRMTQRLRLQDNVEFVGSGWKADFDLSSYYKSADLFLLTSHGEGWGLVVIEAMAAECPVIMTDVGCAGEVVKNGKTGLVIPLNDKKALIAAICDLISDSAKRRELSRNAREAVLLLPSWEETVQAYKGMWEKAFK